MYLCSSQDKDKAECTSLISCICSSVSPVWTLRLSNTLLCQEHTRRKQQITCVPNREIRLHWSNSSVKVMHYAPYSGVIWTGAEWVKEELCLKRRGSRHVHKRRKLQCASSWWSRTFVWDESRQPTVATPFIMGPITEGLWNVFSTRMSIIVYSRNLARFSSHTRTPAAFIVLWRHGLHGLHWAFHKISSCVSCPAHWLYTCHSRCAYVSLRVAVALNPKNVRRRGGKERISQQNDTGGKRAPGC